MPEENTGSGGDNASTNPTGVSADDGVLNSTGASENPSSKDVHTPSTQNPEGNDSLDFDNLFKMPTTAEDRGGQSRREYAKENNPSQPEVKSSFEDLSEDEQAAEGLYQQFKERLMNEEGERFDKLDKVATHTEESIRRGMESEFPRNARKERNCGCGIQQRSQTRL